MQTNESQNQFNARIHTTETVALDGDLVVPKLARGLVVFAHGSGSSRCSPRNRPVAEHFQREGLGTLLFDLLTEAEEASEVHTRHLRFNIPLLAERLMAATAWVTEQETARDLPIGYFGSSTGAAAALIAAAELGDSIGAIVSRGGRPDLAGEELEQVVAPTLLIVGERDVPVIELNEQAQELLHCEKELNIVPKATHLFEEPGTLDRVAQLASEWFQKHLHPKHALQQ
jgi:pimeloyl-ACP methyl ester carboxylesterase